MLSVLNDVWQNLIYTPIFNLLILFYHLCFKNMGLAIIGVTLFVKIITYPLTVSSLKLSRKQRELKPEIDKIKEQYTDKQVVAQKQMELYRKHGINPAAGCLPQIITLIFIIAPLYNVFTKLLSQQNVMLETVNSMLYNWPYLKFLPGEELNTSFLFFDLSKPNYYIPVVAALAQFYLSRLMTPPTKKLEKVAKKTPDKVDDVMYNMQEQMPYTMPILTFIIGIGLPSGLVWYWFVSTLLTALQYVFLNYYGKKRVTVKN